MNEQKAQQLHLEAMALEEEGRLDDAIGKYEQALLADPEKSGSHYNIGLICKYRGDWPKSFEHNRLAYAIDPHNEGARWNLGIAATALRDWSTARRVWRDVGLELDETPGPIDAPLGTNPIRLNPDGNGEVVWAYRIDPARARIASIPFPESGYRFDDIVLNDGAPVGSRMLRGEERYVFDALALAEASTYSTFVLAFETTSPELVEQLCAQLTDAGLENEDWTSNVRVLCRQCSEGTPHQHDESEQPEPAWNPQRRVGIAALMQEAVQAVLAPWGQREGVAFDLSCALTPSGPGAGQADVPREV